jgi:hypothetical protein
VDTRRPEEGDIKEKTGLTGRFGETTRTFLPTSSAFPVTIHRIQRYSEPGQLLIVVFLSYCTI